MKMHHLLATSTLVCASLFALSIQPTAEATPPSGNKLLLIGFDGGEWSIIEDLWKQGEMQNFKELADRGTRAGLVTQYGQSPVIWTTIASGHDPEQHGITGFVVATDDGDVPVSSEMRKVPAIWNMTSSANLVTNVVGWWGSWPAENVNGVNITERCQADVANCATPAAWETKVKAGLDGANSAHKQLWPGKQHFAPEDRVTTEFAPQLAGEDFDFMAMYLHGTDPNSHKYWRYYRSDEFPELELPTDLDKHKDRIPRAYRAVDEVVGRVLESAGDDTNILIVSDHGFHRLDEVTTKVTFDLDKLFIEMGWAEQGGDGKLDVANSRAFTYGSALNEHKKRVRVSVKGRDDGGQYTEAEVAGVRAELERELAKVTYPNGKPAFLLRDNADSEVRRGGDFIIEGNAAGVSKTVTVNGKATTGIIKGWVENSGGHSGNPKGVFLAAGPDIQRGANVDGIRIHDVTPTALYGLGLPVADDMAGKAWTDLYSADFQKKNPKKSVATYGTRSATDAATGTTEDEAVLEQLRMLGYLD
ncbi:MAG: sulfatase-like hydrolase/transferase [Proteobacteria bacterium]|nr:sulfatase-like hydrolase/transferase [Pseudomonadota bacterium]MCP4917631.1 sulfatase-like hydrolase/transferase [Pseudomonadota bacterium]